MDMHIIMVRVIRECENPERYLSYPCCGEFLQNIANSHLQSGVLHEPGRRSKGFQRLIELICKPRISLESLAYLA